MQNTTLLRDKTGVDTCDVDTWVAQRIAQDGYAQIALHDPASGLPGFAFTIGLTQSRGLPELLCLGVAPDIAARLFSLCIDAHDAGDFDLRPESQDLPDLIAGFTLRIRAVPAAMIDKANGLRPASQPAIAKMGHLLMPDNHGHFPGDPACDPQVAAAQDIDWLLAPTCN